MTNDILIDETQINTLLIVDDSVENLQLLSALLKDTYKLRVAKSGEKALDILRSDNSIDLVLLDILMPGMNGYEVCVEIRKDPIIEHLPIIFLTALSEAHDEKLGFQSGGDDFITKPFHPEIVMARISLHLKLQNQRKKSERLLKVMLPEKVIQQLLQKGNYTPELYHNVSVMFCDLVDFTSISANLSPIELVDELSDIFTNFDEIAAKHKITRIKTIGDAYMACSGLEYPELPHAQQMVEVGILFIQFLQERNKTHKIDWKCRIGIHSGNVIAGIIGTSRFQFDIMGDDVNIASRVESAGTPMQVTMTKVTRDLLPSNLFITNPLGEFQLKGKGKFELYSIDV
jgi:class 3 adenylate cyclase